MDMLVSYGLIAAFFVVVIVVLEASRSRTENFTDYAVAGRSFGSFFQGMAFLNTWLPGSFFIGFAGLAASGGVIGFYYLPYSLLVILLMWFMARPVARWGEAFDLRTQSDLLGMRYGSKTVRVVCALVGMLSAFPWIVLAMQSLGLVFEFLSFGRVTHLEAVVIGVAVLAVRQLWTVRMGMRGIVISDVVQAVIAYPLAVVVVGGLTIWLTTNGLTIDKVPDSFFTLPGPGSELGPLYLFALVLTGALGGWCWPDIFARLFSANGAEAIKKSALIVAPLLLLFATSLTVMAILASSLEGVADRPDAVLLITAAEAGGAVLAGLVGMMIVAATVGNVNANLQASGVQVANDMVGVAKPMSDRDETRVAKGAVTALTIISAILASFPNDQLVTLAIVSYQGVVQLAPALLLGIFWMRGNKFGALAGTTVGFAVAATLQVMYPLSAIPWLWGLTSGIAGLAVNVVIYVVCAYLLPHGVEEEARLIAVFRTAEGAVGEAEPPTVAGEPATAGS